MDAIAQFLNPNNPIIYLIIIWALTWKGLALWRSAQNRQLAWFIALLLINTVGILEILYLIFFSTKASRKDSDHISNPLG